MCRTILDHINIDMSEELVFDPPETFAHVASCLRRDPPRRLDMSRWLHSPKFRGAVEALGEEVIHTGEVRQHRLIQALRGQEAAFLLLRAIDEAFATIDPYVGVRDHGRLGRYIQVFQKRGRYNEDDRFGWVVPRRSFPTRPLRVPDHEADNLRSLMLVPPLPRNIHFRRTVPELDFAEEIRDVPYFVVGCVPFLNSLDELDIRRIDDVDSWYAIKTRTDDAGWMQHWQERITRVLTNLDVSGAHIGMLPELALTDEMLIWWKRQLRRNERPPGSNLTWVLVGTGPITDAPGGEQQPNQAVLLHRDTGETIMRQDKCEPFTLSEEHINDWQLTTQLSPGPLAEWMREGRERYVEDSRVGRIAILICEDLARLLSVGAQLASLAPTHLLVPIFAPPILRFRWQQRSADTYANAVGSASVVANSYAVKLSPKAADANPKPGDVGCALALMPKQHGPTGTWSADVRLGDAGGDPETVVLFTLPRG